MRRLLGILLLTLPLFAEEIALDTGTGKLNGTLLVPATTAKVPVVLIISGSGPTDRNGNSILLPGMNNSLKMLAEALLERGIASLRYDKRGVATSAAAMVSESELRFDTYVADAVAWARLLLYDPRFSSVAVAGHSEGSLIGILAAQQTGIARVVSIAGPGRPADEVLLEQLEKQLSGELLETSRTIIASLKEGKTVADVTVLLYALFRPSVQPYLISWFRYDPAAEAAKLRVPLLVLQGTTDVQVPVSDAERLARAYSGAKLAIIEGMNHVLKDVPADPEKQTASYSDSTLPVDAMLVAKLEAFIEHAPRRRAVRHSELREPAPTAFVLAGEPIRFNGVVPFFTNEQVRRTSPATRTAIARWASTPHGRKLIADLARSEFHITIIEDADEPGTGRAPQPGLATLLAASNREVPKAYEVILNPTQGLSGVKPLAGFPATDADMVTVACAGEMLHVDFYTRGISLPHHGRADFQREWAAIAKDLGYPTLTHGVEAEEPPRRLTRRTLR